MKTHADDKIKCDTCANYTVSPGGCTEWCAINLREPYRLRQWYFEQRRDGIVKHCKEFSRL